MIRPPSLAAVVLLVLVAHAGPREAVAQSLMGSEGLGFPVEPLDARARGLGSVGPGLFGWHLSAYDPAAAAGLIVPSVTGSFQPSASRLEREGEEVEVGGTRFPFIGISYPFERGVLTVSFAGALDQEWEARHESVLELGGQPVPVEDVFRSRGGISTLRVGWARSLGADVSVGLGGGVYVGSMEREFTRTFDRAAVGEDVEPFGAEGRWDARGPNATAGVVWQPGSSLRLGGTVHWGGDLRLRPTEGTTGERRSYSLPTEYRIGASGMLTPVIMLTLGAGYADWSQTGEDLERGETVEGAWTYGGGLEWQGLQLLGRDLPIRLGVRSLDLPFLLEGQEVSETVTSGGIGLHLSEVEDIPLARLDLAVERGSRDAGPISERFWRTTLTLRLAGG